MGDPPAYGDELTALSECVMANAPDVCICMSGGMCENYGGDRYCHDMGCAEWEGCMMGRPNHGNDDDDMGMGPGMGMGPTGEPYDPSGPEHGDGPDGGGTSGGDGGLGEGEHCNMDANECDHGLSCQWDDTSGDSVCIASLPVSAGELKYRLSTFLDRYFR